MTAYCTQDDLVALFGEAEIKSLADRDEDGNIDAAVVASAITAAQQTIDSYIGTRYALPLVTVPGAIQKVAMDLARYELYTIEPTKLVSDRRDAAISWLKDISLGKAALDVPAPAPADSAQSGNVILLDGDDRRMSRSELRKL